MNRLPRFACRHTLDLFGFDFFLRGFCELIADGRRDTFDFLKEAKQPEIEGLDICKVL